VKILVSVLIFNKMFSKILNKRLEITNRSIFLIITVKY